MIEQFFDEYNISESELKDKIYKTYCELCRLRPEKWSSDFLELLSPDQPSLQILGILSKDSPEQIEDLLNAKRATVLELLRITSFSVDTRLKDIYLEELLSEQFFRYGFHHIYKVIFISICKMFFEKQQNEINFDRDLIYESLDKNPENFIQVIEILEAIIFVNNLRDYFALDEKNNVYIEQLYNYIESVAKYAERNYLSSARLSMGNLFAEGCVKYLNDIGFDEPLTSEKRNEILNLFRKINNQFSSERLEIKRGGTRPKKGFVWTEEHKKAFYEQVITLPKIKDIPMWEYALNELMEKDFDFYIEEYLKNKTPFKKVPPKLFNEAIKTWKKYKDDLITIKPSEKPRAFEFRHAVHLLQYTEIAFSTSVKYFSEGKKLSSLNK